jgi:uncharacterized repeat protein (TIGR03803 family)
VVREPAGDLYGTTNMGGLGYGVVYKLDTAGEEAVLYTFTGKEDGANPEAGVILGLAGNLYGTTPFGGRGVYVGVDSPGAGVLYKVAMQ